MCSTERRYEAQAKRKLMVEEAAGILWMVIDEAKSYMAYPLTASEERRHLAKVLTGTIGV